MERTRRVPVSSRAVGYALAVLGTVAVVGVRMMLGDGFSQNPSLMLFLVPVLLAAYVGGLGPGLVATALSALAARYFLLDPIGSFAVNSSSSELRAALLIVVSLLICALSEALHRARWRAEAALREQLALRDRLEGVAEATPGLLSTFRMRPDGSGCLPYNSRRFRELYGIDPAAVVDDASPMLALIDPADAAIVADSLRESAQAMAPWHVQYRVRNPERGLRWLETWSMPLREADGSLLWSGFVADITESKRLEASLREGEERLGRALEVTQTGVWEWNIDSGAVFWSSMCFVITGVTHFDGTVAAFRQLLHPLDAQRVTDALQTAVATGSMYQAEFRIMRADGEVRWLRNVGRTEADADDGTQRMIGTVRDITDAKNAEDSRLRSQKLEALGTLTGGIAHDFNNILLAINGNAGLAAAELAPEHPARDSVLQIGRAGARAADLVRQILAFSRAEEPRRHHINLGAVVAEAVQLVRSIVSPLVEIHSDAEADLPGVVADSTQMHEVVLNLATNAADAIGAAGGRIDIHLDAAAIDVTHPDHTLGLAPGRYLRLRVHDDGHGMAPAVVERIFDPFFTTKEPGRGTGLGLSVVHGIVASYGGAIGVETAPDSGTTFRVYFPAADAVAVSPAPQAAAPRRGQGERVLYVDDDEMLVILISRVLTRLGYEVTGYRDPAQALRDISHDPDSFDVIVTDLSMPGMSGIRLAREILAIRPDLPILMTTGYVRVDDEAAVRAAGVRALILKPNTVDELGVALDEALAAQRAGESAPLPAAADAS